MKREVADLKGKPLLRAFDTSCGLFRDWNSLSIDSPLPQHQCPIFSQLLLASARLTSNHGPFNQLKTCVSSFSLLSSRLEWLGRCAGYIHLLTPLEGHRLHCCSLRLRKIACSELILKQQLYDLQSPLQQRRSFLKTLFRAADLDCCQEVVISPSRRNCLPHPGCSKSQPRTNQSCQGSLASRP
jgi:hypothetical protein